MVSFAGCGIADAKVHAPVPPATFVRRPRMQARVEEATADAAVTTLRAHAGAGKTALLADWARTGSTATAWVSLDPTDNGVGHLWAAVARAVAVRVPEMAEALDGWGAVDPRRPLTPSDLVAVLDALPEELRLVLDDVHELVALERLDELETFIRYRPAHLRLVLAGRSMPPLPWPRLRLQVGVIDLRGEDLRFSRSEAASLISRHRARMTRAQVEQVHATTGGWAAALCLTTIAARRSPDMGDFLADPSRAEEAVAGYLRDEVLDPLPAADRTVLRDLSVCDPVPPSLVTELCGQGAFPVLERLERETSLLTTDLLHRHVRIQPLLRASLYAELARSAPARCAELHTRTAAWFEANGRPTEALEHARSAGDDVLVADLIREWAVPLVLTGRHTALRRACATAGLGAAGGGRHLPLMLAVLDAVVGGPGAGPRPGGPVGEIHLDALRALATLARITFHDGGAGETRAHGPGQRDREVAADAVAAAVDGATRLVEHEDRDGGVRTLETVVARSRDLGYHHLVLQCSALLAAADVAEGDASGMTRHGGEALSAAQRAGGDTSVWSVTARATVAYGSLLRGQPIEARRQAAEVVRAGRGPDREQRLLVEVVHGAAEADSGQLARGLRKMQQARTGFADGVLGVRTAAVVAMLEHETAIVLVRPAHARTVRRWLDARIGRTGEVVLMRVREARAACPAAPIGGALRPVLDGTAPALLPETEIEAMLLEAGDARLSRDRIGARQWLLDALDRAARLELVRPFTHTSWRVRELLAHQVGSFGAADAFARRALTTGIQGRPAGRSLLSDRESTVLRLLPSLATTTEIAEDLHVSPNTIKTQVGAIYSKLGVTDRRAAVVAAYDAGLLGSGVQEPLTTPARTDIIRSG